jgi:hypothetical protein
MSLIREKLLRKLLPDPAIPCVSKHSEDFNKNSIWFTNVKQNNSLVPAGRRDELFIGKNTPQQWEAPFPQGGCARGGNSGGGVQKNGILKNWPLTVGMRFVISGLSGLGHSSSKTTEIYRHISKNIIEKIKYLLMFFLIKLKKNHVNYLKI